MEPKIVFDLDCEPEILDSPALLRAKLYMLREMAAEGYDVEWAIRLAVDFLPKALGWFQNAREARLARLVAERARSHRPPFVECPIRESPFEWFAYRDALLDQREAGFDVEAALSAAEERIERIALRAAESRQDGRLPIWWSHYLKARPGHF